MGIVDSCDRFIWPAFPIRCFVRRTVAMSVAGMGCDAQLGRVHNNGEGHSVAAQRRIGEGSASETGCEGEVAKGKSLCIGKGLGARRRLARRPTSSTMNCARRLLDSMRLANKKKLRAQHQVDVCSDFLCELKQWVQELRCAMHSGVVAYHDISSDRLMLRAEILEELNHDGLTGDLCIVGLAHWLLEHMMVVGADSGDALLHQCVDTLDFTRLALQMLALQKMADQSSERLRQCVAALCACEHALDVRITKLRVALKQEKKRKSAKRIAK